MLFGGPPQTQRWMPGRGGWLPFFQPTFKQKTFCWPPFKTKVKTKRKVAAPVLLRAGPFPWHASQSTACVSLAAPSTCELPQTTPSPGGQASNPRSTPCVCVCVVSPQQLKAMGSLPGEAHVDLSEEPQMAVVGD